MILNSNFSSSMVESNISSTTFNILAPIYKRVDRKHTVNLDKVVKVLECQKNKDQVVVPVLYGVRLFGLEWLNALDSKGFFSSFHYSRKECSDSQLVKEIVRDVYEKLFCMGRIGIYSKLLEIKKEAIFFFFLRMYFSFGINYCIFIL